MMKKFIVFTLAFCALSSPAQGAMQTLPEVMSVSDFSKYLVQYPHLIVKFEQPYNPQLIRNTADEETLLDDATFESNASKGLKFVRINALESTALNKKYAITATPVYLLFKDGKLAIDLRPGSDRVRIEDLKAAADELIKAPLVQPIAKPATAPVS